MWTFGIITGGGQTDSINKMIDSIERQNIHQDKYEIIIVGGSPIDRKNVIHLPFNEADKANWITKKKNMICQKAKFDNIVLTHDYIMFHDGWYDGWLKFGDDNWDVAMNVILNGDGTRFRDWLTQNPLFLVPYNMSAFSKAMYISGTYWCAKKAFMLKFPLNENHVWNQWEDIEWSFRAREVWNYKCNPYSTVQSAKQKVSWINPEATIADAVHYALLEQVVHKNSPYKLIHADARLSPEKNPNVKSIHYVEFDMLRNFIRKNKPSNALVVSTCDCFSSLAVTWAMSEHNGKVDIIDSYTLEDCWCMENIVEKYSLKTTNPESYCYGLMKFLLKQFEWENVATIYVKPLPIGISELPNKYDFVFLDALAMDAFRLWDLAEIKKVLKDNFVLMINMRGTPMSEEMKKFARENFDCEWKSEFSDMAVIRK